MDGSLTNIAVRLDEVEHKFKIEYLTKNTYACFHDYKDVDPGQLAKWDLDYKKFMIGLKERKLKTKKLKLCIFSLSVTSGMLEPFLEGQTLEEVLAAKRIFIVDLKILSRLNLDEPRKVS